MVKSWTAKSRSAENCCKGIIFLFETCTVSDNSCKAHGTGPWEWGWAGYGAGVELWHSTTIISLFLFEKPVLSLCVCCCSS